MARRGLPVGRAAGNAGHLSSRACSAWSIFPVASERGTWMNPHCGHRESSSGNELPRYSTVTLPGTSATLHRAQVHAPSRSWPAGSLISAHLHPVAVGVVHREPSGNGRVLHPVGHRGGTVTCEESARLDVLQLLAGALGV